MRLPARTTLAAVAVLVFTATACSSSSGGGSAPKPVLTTEQGGTGLPGVGTLPRPASAWPEAGHDARFATSSSVIGPRTANVRWRVTLDGDATPGPAIAVDGSVLVATNAGVLHDLDPATGAEKWRFDGMGSYGSDLSTSPAVLANGIVLWPGPNDTLFALTAQGHKIWEHRFGGQVLSPAVAGTHRVYVADLAGGLAALDVSAWLPRIVWTLALGGTDYASPSVGPDGTVYTATDQTLVAVRDLGRRGAIRWRLRTAKMVEVSNPVTALGLVVLGTNGDHEFGVRPDGSVSWALDIGDYTYSSASVDAAGRAYFGDNTGRVRVVNTTTGTVEHTITPLGNGKEKVWTTVVPDSAGNFYWATTEGNVYGYTADGMQLFHLDAGAAVHSYPALTTDGTLYLCTTAGTVYAIGTS